MVTQEIRFSTTRDRVRLAYALAGKGPPLVKAANWLNHLEYDWESPVWRHFLRHLASRFRLLRYDERGNGLSDWSVASITFDALVEDLETVVEASGFDRFDLLGVSQGCAVSIAYAVRHPERVRRLVLFGGYARGWRMRGTEAEIRQREALTTLVREGWGSDNPAFRQVFTSLFFPDGTAEQMRAFNELQRITASPENAARLIEAFSRIDVTGLLPRVAAPTLVLHCREDARIPFDAGREMASGIPGARFVTLESRNHMVLEQDPAWPRLRDEITAFLGADAADAPAEAEPGWDEVNALFEQALELPAERREAWLAERCGAHAGLRERVRRLLRSSDTGASRLRTGGALEAGADLAAAAGPELRAGERLGPYQIVERIGQGGMGTVYRARHEHLGRDVAIKSIAGLLASGPEGLRRFEREARLLASLDHPNVATVHDFMVVNGRPFLVLELVDGEVLDERIRRGSMPWEEALEVAVQLAEALAEAHGRGIVHRDLKPGNIRFTPRGRVKVLDFGLAKIVPLEGAGSSGSFATASMTLLGTPGYMSPEQARGLPIDARADLWAFGCVLYEMLAGRRAFAAGSLPDAIAAALRDEPDWALLPVDAPSGLVEAIRDCLQKDPERRPARIEELIARLRPLIASRTAAGADAAPPGARRDTDPASARLPGGPAIAVLPLRNLGGDPAQQYFAEGLSEDLITGLCAFRSLFVVARSSSFRFAGEDAGRAARALGVRYVVDGSVRRHAAGIRLSIQLIDGETGAEIWARRFDCAYEELFTVQDELTRTIAGAIEPELGRAERERIALKHPGSFDAWECYQQGMARLHGRTAVDLEAARGHFTRALELDRGLVAALAGLEEVSFFQVVGGLAADPDAAAEECMGFARAAVELDPRDPLAHYALGRAHLLRREGARAIAALERAVELNPSFAWAHYALGMAYGTSGRPADAPAPLHAALRLSPHDPYRGQFMVRLGEAALFAGRHEEALAWAERSLAEPHVQWSRHALRAAALGQLGRPADARESIRALKAMLPEVTVQALDRLWPISAEPARARLLEGLRRAGVPESAPAPGAEH